MSTVKIKSQHQCVIKNNFLILILLSHYVNKK